MHCLHFPEKETERCLGWRVWRERERERRRKQIRSGMAAAEAEVVGKGGFSCLSELPPTAEI